MTDRSPLTCRDESTYRSAVEMAALYPFDLGDERVLRKALKHSVGTYTVPLAQALEDVKAARAKRLEANTRALPKRRVTARPGDDARRP